MRKLIVAEVVAGCLLVAAFAGARATVDDATQRARHLVKRGMQQLANGRMEKAQKLLAEAAKADPNMPEAFDGLARVAARIGDWRGAAAGLAEAERLYVERARRRLESEQDYVLRLQETQTAFWDMMASFDGAACMAEKDWRRFQPGKEITTDAHMEDFTPDGVPAGVCFRHGVALLHLGRVAEARAELQRELAASPERGEVHVNLAVCAMRLGDPDEALRELDRAAALGASEPKGLRAEILAQQAARQPETPETVAAAGGDQP